MSMGQVSKSKQELEGVYPPLIRVESKKFDKGVYHDIAITDIWAVNHAFFKGDEVTVRTSKGGVFHSMKEYRSLYETLPSPGETKKNPIQEEPVERDSEISDFQKIIQALQDLGGGLNPMTADLVNTWLEKKHTVAWITKAIAEAKAKGARDPKYVDKILIGWEANGYPKSREEQIADRKAQGKPNARTEPDSGTWRTLNS